MAMKRKPEIQIIGACLAARPSLSTKTAHLDPHGRRLANNPGGARRKFDDTAAQRVQEKLRGWIFTRRTKHCLQPGPAEKETMKAARKFAEAQGVSCSDGTLRRRVIDPVFRALRKA
jgi:hypothetical protein